MFITGIIIGLVVGVVLTALAYERRSAVTHQLRAEGREKRSEFKTTLSDPEMGPLIGDEEGEKAHSEFLERRHQEITLDARSKHYAYTKTLTKDEDANELLYYIAVLGEETFFSRRPAAALLGFGSHKIAEKLDYLERNRYIRAVETVHNKGTKYMLTDKSDLPR